MSPYEFAAPEDLGASLRKLDASYAEVLDFIPNHQMQPSPYSCAVLRAYRGTVELPMYCGSGSHLGALVEAGFEQEEDT